MHPIVQAQATSFWPWQTVCVGKRKRPINDVRSFFGGDVGVRESVYECVRCRQYLWSELTNQDGCGTTVMYFVRATREGLLHFKFYSTPPNHNEQMAATHKSESASCYWKWYALFKFAEWVCCSTPPPQIARFLIASTKKESRSRLLCLRRGTSGYVRGTLLTKESDSSFAETHRGILSEPTHIEGEHED